MKKIDEKKLMLFIVIITVVLVGLGFGFTVIFGGAKKVALDYAKGMSNFDSKLIADLYLEEMFKESYETKEDMIKELDVMFENMMSSGFQIIRYEFAKDYKIYKEQELEERKKILIEYYKIDDTDIKEIRRYDVTFYCVDDNGSKEVEMKLNIAKIKNKWYLISTE